MNGNHHNPKPDQTQTTREKLTSIYEMMDESAVFSTAEHLINIIVTDFSDIKTDASAGSLCDLELYAADMADVTLRLSVLMEVYMRKVEEMI